MRGKSLKNRKALSTLTRSDLENFILFATMLLLAIAVFASVITHHLIHDPWDDGGEVEVEVNEFYGELVERGVKVYEGVVTHPFNKASESVSVLVTVNPQEFLRLVDRWDVSIVYRRWGFRNEVSDDFYFYYEGAYFHTEF